MSKSVFSFSKFFVCLLKLPTSSFQNKSQNIHTQSLSRSVSREFVFFFAAKNAKTIYVGAIFREDNIKVENLSARSSGSDHKTWLGV